MPSFMCMPFLACNRQVDSLDKRQCNLQHIPGDIERYARSLEELLLDMNHIRDLPKSLFRLQKLQRLGLSDNDIHRLPPEVSALHNLVELNLSRNDISDLPEELKVCSNLQLLDISSNPIARLPDSITLCISLTQLSLNDISLTKLPQDIGKLGALKSLEARENHLRALPPSIAELVHLQRLDLGQNELDELPPEIGSLRSLQELYVDENSLEKLPDSLLRCSRLEQLDASTNRIFQLPEALGDLSSLVDLTVSHNCLRELPSSLGRLKRLTILKADDNTIDSLTPAIGGCTSIDELYLQQNLISELPSSIGNLQRLQTLNLDRCQLRRLPALVGECQSLTVLSLRDNRLEELPMEIGKLARLRVLDVCNNRLAHLPFTINVLRELQALWLSENQSQALLRFQQNTDPRTGIKVLSCYLLPQQMDAAGKANGNGPVSSSGGPPNNANKAAFVGGPKVHFGGEDEHQEEQPGTSGKGGGEVPFERKNTPHPKPTAPTAVAAAKHHKKQQVDGHIAPRMEEHPQSIVLSGGSANRRSSSQDHFPSSEPGSSSNSKLAQKQQQQESMLPRSALKYSSRTVIQAQQQQNEGTTVAEQQQSGDRDRQHQRDGSIRRVEQQMEGEQKRVIVRRDANAGGGLGLSIAGGIESTPFIEEDPGIFISKLVSRGAAERAGIRVGDKVLEVNGTSMMGQRHQLAVECIQQRTDGVELLIERRSGSIGAQSSGTISHLATDIEHPAAKSSSSVCSLPHQHITASSNSPTPANPTPNPIIAAPAPSAPRSSAPANFNRPTTPQSLSHLHSSSTSSTLPAQNPAIKAADLLYGDIGLDGVVEEVDLVRDSRNSLGLSIVGGIDHCSHPFGSPAHPGVFISKITANLPAHTCRRLRIGDRILRVNEADISNAKHNEAVEILKCAGRSLRLSVCHEPQPRGLRSVLVNRQGTQPLGLSICGGIGSAPVNPEDRTDEGIFIERVERGGAADNSAVGLCLGTRILEVNDDSLLGCTKEEAAHIFRRTSAGPVRLLVCQGFCAPTSQLASVTVSSTNSPLATTAAAQKDGVQQQQSNSLSLSTSSTAGCGVPLLTSPIIFPAKAAGHQNGDSKNNMSSGANEYQNIVAVAPQHKDAADENHKASHGGPNGPAALLVEQQMSGSVPLLPLSQVSPPAKGITTFSSQQNAMEEAKQSQQQEQGEGGEGGGGGEADGRKIPPPIAPKPKMNITSFSVQHQNNNHPAHGNNSVGHSAPSAANNFNHSSHSTNSTDFMARVSHFEHNHQQHNLAKSGEGTAPIKRPLLSSDDLAKLAEDDLIRQQVRRGGGANGSLLLGQNGRAGGANDGGIDGISPISPPGGLGGGGEKGGAGNSSFEHILNDSPIPLLQPVSSIRTKKAENRFLQQQMGSASSAGNNNNMNSNSTAPSPISQLALEQQKRSEWRQARMASLEAESLRVGQLISDVGHISKIPFGENQQRQGRDGTEILEDGRNG